MNIIQANLQRSKLATAELLETAKSKCISVAMVQEPYVGKTGLLKQYPGTQVIQCTLNRMVRTKNKIIALFQWNLMETPFTQASHLLKHIGEVNTDSPIRISVDTMSVGYEKGVVDNYVGCIEASKMHEVIMYENRGEDLSFLRSKKPGSTKKASPQGNSETLSGSERLQQKRTLAMEPKTPAVANRVQSMLSATVNTLTSSIKSIVGSKEQIRSALTTTRIERALQKFTQTKTDSTKTTKNETKTKADMGQVQPPTLREVKRPLDHVINAFLEFAAITKAEQEVSLNICKDIMHTYRLASIELLQVKLEEAEASIYNNETSQIVIGKETGVHMTAYSASGGFIDLDEEASKPNNPPRFKTPPNDPIVVIARCTRIMLNEKILERAKTVAGSENETLEFWDIPKIKWVNGVPGCGKTTWIVRNFDPNKDIVITTTTEAAKDLREKLKARIGAETKTKVRTMASVLVNGLREPDRKTCNRLMVDEALMNHFGAIVMATKLAGASETLLIGDKNQLPFIDRNNLFKLNYCRPDTVAKVDLELLCTHRNPMDVAFALSEVYNGIYASKSQIRSLELQGYTGAQIPKTMEETLYLTHTQSEKEDLIAAGYGTGKGSRVNTIHEAQGATFETVMLIRSKAKKIQLHDSVSHAVVAVSRHTKRCIYYTDDISDAAAHFILKAVRATAYQIREYNVKMSIQAGDETVTKNILTTGY